MIGSTDIGNDRAGMVLLPGHPGRRVELVSLGEDCLRDGVLHDGIRLRLLRIRELPNRSVATLLGVWRRDGRTWLAWESLDQPTLKARLAAGSIHGEQLRRVMESLRRSVQSVHRQGLVHGELREENVVLRDDAVVLTRFSPLLHHDPQRDLDALASMEARLRDRMAEATTETAPAGDRPDDPFEDRRSDVRGWIGLAAALASGAIMSLAAWWVVRMGA